MATPPRAIAESLRRELERRLLSASRRAYANVSGYHSQTEGLEGWLEELAWGLEHLDEAARAEADRRVLERLFFGPIVVSVLGRAAAAFPDATARAFAVLTPWVLRWMIGDASTPRPRVTRLPDCTFRRKGGPRLCEQVCRRPAERFCRERLVAVDLRPESGSFACTWTWGEDQVDEA